MELGKIQTLKVNKEVEFGVYLADPDNADPKQDERVLLPGKQVPEGTKTGDLLEVFLYKDSSDRLIATTARPAMTLGEVALLKVAQVGRIGAFLDWGLEKDLLLPFKEQTRKVEDGDEVLAALYVDKSGRLAATMKVYHYLHTDSPYKKDDTVHGMIYEISKNFGAFVAVDDRYSALISTRELYGNKQLQVGDRVEARIISVKADGKLDLSIREKAYLQIGEDAEAILRLMEEMGGSLPFTDKADPELIREKTGMSKNEFKRAVGNLLKNGKIRILEDSIEVTTNDK
ncbi:MAG: S1 RNA-binding domain-containing protein [Lachnospiraceae bacterium]|nr:S1 RNA-binding domain-containing protein [Lachnospiraceae bacterium]